ncbi:hypothetical protein DFH07DRAFT_816693 [Mycena maculata]|uniref:Uncharacterized protein n=1 Tax=Mycena maculata TaxID=230809 RepID=A0AAD7J9P4_9AGAR|nr:hypothetical protein DFH07DRAFT_816693 [Mycena maculata]
MSHLLSPECWALGSTGTAPQHGLSSLTHTESWTGHFVVLLSLPDDLVLELLEAFAKLSPLSAQPASYQKGAPSPRPSRRIPAFPDTIEPFSPGTHAAHSAYPYPRNHRPCLHLRRRSSPLQHPLAASTSRATHVVLPRHRDQLCVRCSSCPAAHTRPPGRRSTWCRRWHGRAIGDRRLALGLCSTFASPWRGFASPTSVMGTPPAAERPHGLSALAHCPDATRAARSCHKQV